MPSLYSRQTMARLHQIGMTLKCVLCLTSRVCLPRLGLQAGVESWFQTDPALALHPGAAAEGGVPRCHRLAGGLRRIRHQRPGRGGTTVGRPQVQAPDEL